MNVNNIPVYNGANLSMFMVNVSQALLRKYGGSFSVNDLRAWFRGRKYAHEIFKLLPQKPMLFRYYFENRLTNSAPLFHSDLGDIDYEKSTELESTMS
jgi:hypothetical protein